MAKGDHLVIFLDYFTHHGIDLGDGTVVHWSTGGQGLKDLFGDAAVIRRTSHAAFADGKPVWVRAYASCFDDDTVVARALSSVGALGYNVAQNNCEHFATWCKTGEPYSEQVKDATALVAGGTAIQTGVVGGLGVVSAAGSIPGLSAPGPIAGLGSVGRLLGGGPAFGLIALVSVPAVASVLTVGTLLNDHTSLPEDERRARDAARTAGIGGAVAGAAAALAALASAGMPGLSAGGISSGLAALGCGSIGLGLAAILAVPAVACLVAACLVYRLGRPAAKSA